MNLHEKGGIYSVCFIFQICQKMLFDEQLEPQPDLIEPSLPAMIEEDRSSLSNTIAIKFDTLVRFLNRFSNMRGIKKTNYAKQFIKLLFKSNRSPAFTYPIIRLLLPSEDKDRGNYGLKQKNLSKLISDSLNITKEDYLRLHHYKNPSFHKTGVGIGDFSLCTHDVIKNYCKEQSILTVIELNEMLDDLASSSKNHINIFRKLFTMANAEEIKWIIRIILKDLKISLKITTVLNTFHHDANDFFNLTNSLIETCKKFQNPNICLDDQVKIFFPIRPMLAGKKKIVSLKDDDSKIYYVETKFDGERLQVHKKNSQVKLFSRNGIDYTKIYENFVQIVVNHVMAEQCILDGQIIVIQKDGHKMAAFGMNKVVALQKQSDQYQLCYKIFDILWLKEDDQQINLMKFPLRQRKQMITKVIKEQPGVFQKVCYEEIHEYDDILKRFSDSMDRNEEGIMLKDPQSIYVPKERAGNWIKLKSDYVDGLTDTLDLIILGGYYGDSAARHGMSKHWTDQITSFVLGVIDRIDPINPKIAYAIPFAKVGTGYSVDELSYLRLKLKDNLIKNEGRSKPQYLQCNWKPALQDKPDCWVGCLSKSIVLEIKAAELIVTDSYPTNYTLRFPRVVKIRYDKDWNQTLTMNDLKELTNSSLYSKHMKKKNDDSGSDQEGKEKRRKDEDQKQKGNKKQRRLIRRDEVYEEYMGFSMQNEKLVSHLFNGFEFCCLQQLSGNYQKLDIQKQILLHDGTIVQNPLPSTQYIITDVIDYKLRAFQTQKNKRYTFIKPNYITNCIFANKILPLSPLYLTVLPEGNAKYYRDNFDRFGDSYTNFLDLRELNQILDCMNGKYAVNQNLMEHITLRYQRRGKVSICFGLTDLQKIKLRMHENKIVTSFDDQPNNIIIDGLLAPWQANRINQYKRDHKEVTIEFKDTLIANKIL